MSDIEKAVLRAMETFITQKGQLPLTGISTDTRTIKQGDVFVALKGENFDGHDFVLKALEKGASGIICLKSLAPDDLSEDLWVFGVENTLFAYQDIARLYLEQLSVKKIALTGTSGKTTTKEFLRAVLSTRYSVYANKGNFNNQVGVPFSILEVEDEDIAIFELGAGEKGDVKRLSSLVNPDICIVINVGEGHLEFLENIQQVAKEKSSILEFSKIGFCPNNILYDKYFIDFEKVDLDIFDKIEEESEGYQLTVKDIEMYLPYWGEHNLWNFALSVKVALFLGLSPKEIKKGIKKITLPSFRGQKKKKKGITFILDCYNANPFSVKKAVKAFSEKEGRKFLVLGDMLELGAKSPEYHKNIGDFLNQFDLRQVFFYGQIMMNAYDSYKGIKFYCEDKKELAVYLKEVVQKNDLVLIKGSRGMKMEEVFEVF